MAVGISGRVAGYQGCDGRAEGAARSTFTFSRFSPVPVTTREQVQPAEPERADSFPPRPEEGTAIRSVPSAGERHDVAGPLR